MSLGEIEKLIMYLPQMWEDRTGEFANWENGWHISPVIQYEGHLDNPDELYFVSKRECPVHGKDEGYKKNGCILIHLYMMNMKTVMKAQTICVNTLKLYGKIGNAIWLEDTPIYEGIYDNIELEIGAGPCMRFAIITGYYKDKKVGINIINL